MFCMLFVLFSHALYGVWVDWGVRWVWLWESCNTVGLIPLSVMRVWRESSRIQFTPVASLTDFLCFDRQPTPARHLFLAPIQLSFHTYTFLLMTWPQLMFSHCQIYIHPASSSPSPVSLQCQIVTQDEYHDWQPGKLRRPVTHLPISVSEGYLRLASPLFLFLLSSTILLPPSVLSYLLNGLVASPSLKSSTAPRKPERDRNCTEKHS